MVYSGYGNDIRQTVGDVPLYIPALMTGSVSLPYVDRLADGKTAFAMPIRKFIGGVNGQTLAGGVPGRLSSRDLSSIWRLTSNPAIVGDAEGNKILVATFGA